MTICSRSSEKMVNSPNWEDLPEELLIEIAKRLGAYEDFESFRDVCRRWRSAWTKSSYGGKAPPVPWLMVQSSTEEAGGGSVFYRSFYCLSKSKIVGSMRLPRPILDTCCTNSSHGWLLTISRHLSLSLFNPFSGAQIPLPDKISLHGDYENFADKGSFVNSVWEFALSSSPSLTACYTVIIVYSNRYRLAFWRPGDYAWTGVDDNFLHGGCTGIASLNQQFYALNTGGQIVACTFDDDAWNWKKIGQRREGELIKVHLVADLNRLPIRLPFYLNKAYLVESEGKLLAVVQDCEDIGFLVLDVNPSDGETVVVTDLGDRSLFIDDDHCIPAKASDRYGCKPNCIYFIHKQWSQQCEDICCFSLEDGLIRPHGGQSLGMRSSIIWIEPRR